MRKDGCCAQVMVSTSRRCRCCWVISPPYHLASRGLCQRSPLCLNFPLLPSFPPPSCLCIFIQFALIPSNSRLISQMGSPITHFLSSCCFSQIDVSLGTCVILILSFFFRAHSVYVQGCAGLGVCLLMAFFFFFFF